MKAGMRVEESCVIFSQYASRYARSSGKGVSDFSSDVKYECGQGKDRGSIDGAGKVPGIHYPLVQ